MKGNSAAGLHKSKGIIILFLAPAFILFTAIIIIPAIRAFPVALTNYTLLKGPPVYIGLNNFKELLVDRSFYIALRNTLIIAVVGGIGMFTFAFLFAVSLMSKRIRYKAVFQSLIFMPYCFSEVGVGLFWIFFLNPGFGALNGFFRAVGLQSWALNWLGEPKLAMATIIYVILWTSIGFYMIYLMAGIKSIPQSLFDAAHIDGASEIQTFFRVTLPLIRDYVSTAIVLWLISAINAFGIVFVLTHGGPGGSTHTITTYMVTEAFAVSGLSSVNRIGYGTAVSIIIFLMILITSIFFFRLARKEAIEF
jgi:ABC-type sugar transport system permease subunit